MSDKEKPQFSRNLEFSAGPADSHRIRRSSPEDSALVMSPEEKLMYFQVEGRKILEMLARELERPEPDPASIILINDLHRSWRALWRGDDSFPIGPFSEMFELAFSVLSSIAVIGRGTSLEEKMLLDELKEYMARLVSGSPGLSCLDSCRRLIEKAIPVAGKLKDDSLVVAGKAPVQRETGSGNTGERSRMVRMPAARNDISSSVDEWFDQVTRLMVQPPASTKEEPPGGSTIPPTDETAVSEEPGLPEFRPFIPVRKELDNSRTVSFQDEKYAGRIRQKSAGETSADPGEADTAAKGNLTEGETPSMAEIAGTSPAREFGLPEVAPKEPETAPLPEFVEQTDESGAIAENMDKVLPEETPGCTEESIAGQTSADSPPPEVMAYFRDLSTVTLEVLRHNLAEIADSPGRRGARLVVSYLEQLRSTALDFGLEGRVPAVEGVRESLVRLGISRSERERETLLRRVGEFADQVSSGLS